MKTSGLISLLCLAAVPVFAVNFGEKPNTPKLPGVPYVVHDGTRPQPRVVDNAGAVSVKPPADAIVLFDGKSLDAWRSKDGSPSAFLLKDGVMVANKTSTYSKQEFGDVQIHFEWRLPAERKVKGQHGGNSGIFLMDRYEVQVLQSHNNKTYPDGQAAALYGQTPPLVNATTKQGDWQSYDILFRAPRYEGEKVVKPASVTILHNGVAVQVSRDYLGPTSHKKLAKYPAKHPKKAPIRMQWHSDPMQYRNFWVRELGEYEDEAK